MIDIMETDADSSQEPSIDNTTANLVPSNNVYSNQDLVVYSNSLNDVSDSTLYVDPPDSLWYDSHTDSYRNKYSTIDCLVRDVLFTRHYVPGPGEDRRESEQEDSHSMPDLTDSEHSLDQSDSEQSEEEWSEPGWGDQWEP